MMYLRIESQKKSNPTVIIIPHLTDRATKISYIDILNYSWIRFIPLLDPQVHHLDMKSEKNFAILSFIAEIIATLLSLFVTQSVGWGMIITVGFDSFHFPILRYII